MLEEKETGTTALYKPTFLVPGVLFKRDVSEMKNSRHNSEDVGFLFSAKTHSVHGLLKNFELFGIMYGRIGTGGGVKVLVIEKRKNGFKTDAISQQMCLIV